MDAKFLDDDKPKTSVKVSDFIDLILLHLLWQMLANFSGIESERTVSKFRKRKSFCAVFTYFIKRSREIRKFHVAVVQRRLRNVQKSVMHVQLKGGHLREVVAHGGSTVLTSGIVNLM